jgi:phosphatidylglycerophosphate synthase
MRESRVSSRDATANGPTTRGLIAGTGPVKLWGLPPEERLRRAFARAKLAAADAPVGPDDRTAVFRADVVFDESLVRAVARTPGVVLMLDGRPVAANVPALAAQTAAAGLLDDRAPVGGRQVDAVGLVGTYDGELRKRGQPLLARLSPETLGGIEKRMFQGAYKGVTDGITKYVWPWPARQVTRLCAAWGLTPNMVTLVGLVLTLAAFFLFREGLFGWGLLAGWVMTFLDTVDGKLARVTLTSSRFGNIFDHGIDLIHPPFWWWAWWTGLEAMGTPAPFAGWVLAAVVVGYVVQRIIEGLFIQRFGIHVHVWRRFDSFFRLITARRNPNLVILTLAWAVGRPDLGLFLVAAWTLLSLAVHVVQLGQAFVAPAPVRSWLDA